MAYYLIIRGPLGCGKSTIARRLAARLKAHYVGIDRVLDEHLLTEDCEDGYISQKSFKRANKIVTPVVVATLRTGIPVILDGNFYWRSQIDDLVDYLGYPHQIFTLTAPLEACIERDKNRSRTHGEDATRAVYAKSASLECGILVDATCSIDECLKKIKQNLPK
jgi:predicted kinase